MKKLFFLLIPVVFFTAACGGSNQAESEPAADMAPMTESAATPADEGVAISLVSPEDAALPMGDAELVLQVMDPATGDPVAVENLQVDLSMSMDGMEPMTTMALVEPGEETGQYKVMTNLGMQGMWMMEVTSADPAMQGEATFNLEVK
ncbi:FixH family protein [Nodosilinea sp. LEGE 07088]|uniref:FixH family protein n=1 Tax=Nodosilinea sp. LEGE 07088 TaxID=2777968 RepID=UPI00187FE103|nr:FixH family protein [Nodosilinea sp. LEGE 07088]MBE9135700.1 FixH family protein [Nodosilinea sp. LEGE 07088]